MQEAAKEDPAATVDALTPVFGEDLKAEQALPAATVEAIREEAQFVTETAKAGTRPP